MRERALTKLQRAALAELDLGELRLSARGDVWRRSYAGKEVAPRTVNSLVKLGLVELHGGGGEITRTSSGTAVHTHRAHNRARLRTQDGAIARDDRQGVR